MGGVNDGICSGCECVLRQDAIFASEPHARVTHMLFLFLKDETRVAGGGRNHRVKCLASSGQTLAFFYGNSLG